MRKGVSSPAKRLCAALRYVVLAIALQTLGISARRIYFFTVGGKDGTCACKALLLWHNYEAKVASWLHHLYHSPRCLMCPRLAKGGFGAAESGAHVNVESF
jgi:hypothetical protein